MCVVRAAGKRKADKEPTVRSAKVVCTVLAQQPAPDVDVVDVRNLRRMAYNVRRKKYPPIPKSRSEVFDALRLINTTSSQNEELLLSINEENEFIIFSCSTNMKALASSTAIFMDGTFDYCTRHFIQLFTIHGYGDGLYIPLVFCLLPDKTQRTYENCLEVVRSHSLELGHDLSPNTCIVDFEKAIHNAVLKIWPNTELRGCKFHLAQNWFRKIQSLGLVTHYKDVDSSLGKWLKWSFGLPMLNPGDVGEGFSEWAADQPDDLPDTTATYVQYLRNTYTDADATFPPPIWASMTADSSVSTTNACESFHSHFKTNFISPHPHIFLFFEGIKSTQVDTYAKIRSLRTSRNFRRGRTLKKEMWVAGVIARYQNGELGKYQLLKILSTKYRPREEPQ